MCVSGTLLSDIDTKHIQKRLFGKGNSSPSKLVSLNYEFTFMGLGNDLCFLGYLFLHDSCQTVGLR